MNQQNSNSDRTTFKVIFLGEHHDIVIDWNDDNDYKQQQLFEQLEALTGIPSRYTTTITLHETRPVVPDREPEDNINIRFLHIDNNITYNTDLHIRCHNNFVKDSVCGTYINEDSRFHLKFECYYSSGLVKRIVIAYQLIPENEVPEGVCSYFICQHMNTRPFFNKVKGLILNNPLNLALLRYVQPLLQDHPLDHYWEVIKIYRELNIYHYFAATCSFHLNRNII